MTIATVLDYQGKGKGKEFKQTHTHLHFKVDHLTVGYLKRIVGKCAFIQTADTKQ